MNEEAEIRGAEDARIASLLAGDCDKLASLLADDLVHVHANGLIDSKTSLLNSVSEKLDFLKIERPELQIRMFGDTAIVTGPLNQTMRIRGNGAVVEMQAVATQVWVKKSGTWQQNSYHASRIG
jgi:ketosteroid isomerase-like protein